MSAATKPEVGTTVARQDGAPTTAQKKALVQARLERMRPALEGVLPQHTSYERASMLALFYVASRPAVLACDAASICEGVMQIAQWGLEIGRTAHMVPYKGKVVAIADWKGKVELAFRGKSITSYRARVVYENDGFEVEYGLHEKLVHVPTWRADPGKPVGVYAIVGLPSGEQKFDLMSVQAVERIRGRSGAKDSGPWVSDWDEMAKKTVTHRLMKGVPTNPMLAQAEENEQWLEQREAEGAEVTSGLSRRHVRAASAEDYGGGNSFAAEAARRAEADADGVVVEDAAAGASVPAEAIDMSTKPRPQAPHRDTAGAADEYHCTHGVPLTDRCEECELDAAEG